MAGLAIGRWELNQPVRVAALYHHSPEAAVEFEKATGGKCGLSLLIHIADAFVNSLGMDIHPDPAAAPVELAGFSFSVDRLLSRFEPERRAIVELYG